MSKKNHGVHAKPGGRNAVKDAKKVRNEANAKRRKQRDRKAHARMFEFMAGWR